MIGFIIIVLAFLGISMNLAFSSSLTQPDWALALLLASLLARRNNWIWVLPGALFHDLTLHWTFTVSLPTLAVIPFAMIYLDQHLGPGLPQRFVLLLLAVLLLLPWGWGLPACLLTLCLCIPIWHLLARQYAQKPA
jgi:hypothetical protein